MGTGCEGTVHIMVSTLVRHGFQHSGGKLRNMAVRYLDNLARVQGCRIDLVLMVLALVGRSIGSNLSLAHCTTTVFILPMFVVALALPEQLVCEPKYRKSASTFMFFPVAVHLESLSHSRCLGFEAK